MTSTSPGGTLANAHTSEKPAKPNLSALASTPFPLNRSTSGYSLDATDVGIPLVPQITPLRNNTSVNVRLSGSFPTATASGAPSVRITGEAGFYLADPTNTSEYTHFLPLKRALPLSAADLAAPPFSFASESDSAGTPSPRSRAGSIGDASYGINDFVPPAVTITNFKPQTRARSGSDVSSPDVLYPEYISAETENSLLDTTTTRSMGAYFLSKTLSMAIRTISLGNENFDPLLCTAIPLGRHITHLLI